MKIAAINKHQRRVNHYRSLMSDYYSHWSEIRRPAGMKKYLFRQRIEKLRYHEEMIEKLVTEGALQYLKKKRKRDTIRNGNTKGGIHAAQTDSRKA